MDGGYNNMDKIITLLFISSLLLFSENISIEENCLNCHRKEKIPSELIYRRYLSQYSTQENIKSVLFNYLQNPSQETSIMPKQFFLKFPEKEALDLNQSYLEKNIDAYLDFFDIKKKLVLPQ